MTVLVVGGAGYIGSHVNKYFSNSGSQTVILDNLSRGFEYSVKWGTFVKGDIGDRDTLCDIFKRYKIDTVIHLSAFAYVGESVENPLVYYNNNVINTLILLDEMMRNNVKNIVFSSTCATFGEARYLPIDELHEQKPINPYGKTKLIIEYALEDYAKAYGLNVCVLRYFNVAGCDPEGEIGENHDPETHLIPILFRVASGIQDQLMIFGNDYITKDGTCVRDYIHVWDLADAHYKAAEYLKRNPGYHHFNLGNGEGFSVLEMIKEVEKIAGSTVNFSFVARRPGDPPILIGGSRKARESLGWEPRHSSLHEIILTAWNWHLKQAK